MSQIDDWLKALPTKAIEAELDELREKRRGIDRKIEVREQALAIKHSFARDDDGTIAPGHRPQQGVREMHPPLRGREAVRRVLEATPEKETWTIPEMLQAILDRGWTANSHAVQVNMSRMYRDGELSKVATGVYCRPEARRSLLASTQEVQE